MTNEAKDIDEHAYADYRRDLLNRNLSNSESYDRAVLSLSSMLLGVSLAFIKDIVPLDKTTNKEFLLFSWIFFGLAIILTLISFWTSQAGIFRQLQYAEEYYLNNNSEFLKKSNPFATATKWINFSSGVAFISGIICTIVFVSLNSLGGSHG